MHIDDLRLPGASIDEMNKSPRWRYCVRFRLIKRVSIGDKYIVFKENHHRSDSCHDNVM
jgi:hypothetical protein